MCLSKVVTIVNVYSCIFVLLAMFTETLKKKEKKRRFRVVLIVDLCASKTNYKQRVRGRFACNVMYLNY